MAYLSTAGIPFPEIHPLGPYLVHIDNHPYVLYGICAVLLQSTGASGVRVGADNVVTSVADGRVVIIDKVFEPEYINGECIQVSVYMDFFNVHVNYWPIDGEVSYYKYHPGKYMLAYLPKASELNEHTSVGVKSQYGDVFFKQLAGTFARRIVCHAKPGNAVVKSEECGIIKFGSRIDMYLPLDADIKVKIGDLVRGSESIIAELRK